MYLIDCFFFFRLACASLLWLVCRFFVLKALFFSSKSIHASYFVNDLEYKACHPSSMT